MSKFLSALAAIAFALAVVALLAIVGQWDYEEAREHECGLRRLAYNPVMDKCYAPTPQDRPAR